MCRSYNTRAATQRLFSVVVDGDEDWLRGGGGGGGEGKGEEGERRAGLERSTPSTGEGVLSRTWHTGTYICSSLSFVIVVVLEYLVCYFYIFTAEDREEGGFEKQKITGVVFTCVYAKNQNGEEVVFCSVCGSFGCAFRGYKYIRAETSSCVTLETRQAVYVRGDAGTAI